VDCADFKEGSAAWAGCTANQWFNAEDQKMNEAYQQLSGAMKKPEWTEIRKQLVVSQRAWLAHRERHCRFESEIIGGAGGKNLMECQAELTRQRTEYLNGVLNSYFK
jgi:uncharacterized protein YecT (DUF1311 family)